ncbi:hypothetical protein [Flavobacterium dankookense]|uniref:Uncharacterized protein n=1 Tax=Flavobacterium dankookense TaxID=706186 RepID=A0A4R6Q9E8_9FLAO|nr:hypothetical protein [Flavobacterium dankookense]TDP57809.1 hypothetical protein BC748_2626 [Flavobacterium dankookense]
MIVNAIIIISSLIFLLFFVAFVYAFNKQKNENADMDNLSFKLKKINELITEIGVIEHSNIKVERQIEDEHINLEELTRLFKYSNSEEYWIEFIIKNISTEKLTFSLNEILIVKNDQKTKCNLNLLFEKVPEYVDPPYGHRYFDTLSYNNYTLGSSGFKYFTFFSRFKIESTDLTNFKEKDFISIKIDINKFNENLNIYEVIKKVEFIENFKNMKFKNIQQNDEKIGIIKWHS